MTDEGKTLWAVRIDKKKHRFLRELIALLMILFGLLALLFVIAAMKYAVCENKAKGIAACLLPTKE